LKKKLEILHETYDALVEARVRLVRDIEEYCAILTIKKNKENIGSQYRNENSKMLEEVNIFLYFCMIPIVCYVSFM